MELSKRNIDDLLVLIQHARIDISFGEGGSYNVAGKNGEFPFDKKDARKAERAIEFIRKLILKN